MTIRRRRGEAGFTLVELMVALVAGLIVISAAYVIGGASAEHFSEQQRIGQTQTAVRMAMMQLEADIERAGLHATPNSTNADNCGLAPPNRIQAVDFEPGFYTGVLPNAGANPGVAADQVILTGNYATSDAYLVNTVGPTGSQIVLQPNWQAMRRDFGQWGPADPAETPAPPPFDETRFQQVFRAGRMLRLQTNAGKELFVTIQGTDPGGAGMQGPVINVQPNIPVGDLCVGGLADGALVAPLVQIEYAVVDPTTDSALSVLVNPSTTTELDNALGRTNAVLVRRELDFNGAVIAGTTRIVMEYVADFQVEFIFDTSGPGVAPNITRSDDDGAAGVLNVTPEQVRSVGVHLAARTRQHEERFAFVPRTDPAVEPLTSYQVSGIAPGAARVRSLHNEILIPNVAYR
ncbi:MAG: prepilin-type N-terminal cleavage/methylation domain-containing protein [Deltaproteobacteria bacterium]|nr:prepilin-type N-terminal cleavage/methylation domain-containing protein [Deltaproteobacteria bacterium]